MTKKDCSFAIIKNIGKERHLITDGDEIYDTDSEEKAINLVSVLNQNTDSGCTYEVISIPNRKK